jgi:hypothetical protein
MKSGAIVDYLIQKYGNVILSHNSSGDKARPNELA